MSLVARAAWLIAIASSRKIIHSIHTAWLIQIQPTYEVAFKINLSFRSIPKTATQ